ncbi:MAG: Kae1-associated serine/threonine protein kinase [Euryarchaeota archaeon]|nr:Kae1-associated serine/threonine protein kinase [Euryarchaeota archaeon]
MEVIARGAEAVLYLSDGMVVKHRIRKSYRSPELDEMLRTTRTRREARLLALAKRAGVPAPVVLDVDPEEKKLCMSYIPGEKLSRAVGGMDEESLRAVFRLAGELAGRLHRRGVIHGDLTTSNMLLSGEKLYFIDFGLGEVSSSLEAAGTDLLVFRKCVRSTHFQHEELILESFFSGYRSSFEQAEQAMERMLSIERRGRYFEHRG